MSCFHKDDPRTVRADLSTCEAEERLGERKTEDLDTDGSWEQNEHEE